jgi:hypothetical protein
MFQAEAFAIEVWKLASTLYIESKIVFAVELCFLLVWYIIIFKINIKFEIFITNSYYASTWESKIPGDIRIRNQFPKVFSIRFGQDSPVMYTAESRPELVHIQVLADAEYIRTPLWRIHWGVLAPCCNW